MRSEHWQRVEQIYQAALEQPASQRQAFLASACSGDSELLGEVESLLAQEGAPTGGMTAWGHTGTATATAMQLEAGGQVGPYKLEAAIGAGGMGEVFRAVDTRLRRTVAIKFLLGEGAANPVHRRRFLQEARAASALNHPNIVVIYDIANQDGIDFLVMEYVAGQNLKDLIPADGLPLGRVAHVGAQIASALAAAHAAGITHRDIKPANIMVTPSGQVKVLDFGIAKVAPQDDATRTIAEFTAPGMVVGTLAYMSPEQTRGEHVDGRADIFSLGCVLYEAATGRLPFRGASMLAIMHEIATATPAAPSSLRAELPATFDRLIAACLEKNPNQRPGSASEVMQELERLSSGREQAPVRLQTERPSVAVIPFQLRTAGKEDEFLSIALADAVIHRLSSTGKMLVRPIASVARYKGTETEWAQVARDLNVDLVVEGTIQKMGAKVACWYTCSGPAMREPCTRPSTMATWRTCSACRTGLPIPCATRSFRASSEARKPWLRRPRTRSPSSSTCAPSIAWRIGTNSILAPGSNCSTRLCSSIRNSPMPGGNSRKPDLKWACSSMPIPNGLSRPSRPSQRPWN